MKYSSCIWGNDKSSLSDAEDAILTSYCVDARLGKGLRGVGAAKAPTSLPGPGKDVKEELKVKEWEAGKEGEGLKILDLGCGWGSLGLFLAEVSCHLCYCHVAHQFTALSRGRHHHVVQLAHSEDTH